MLGRVNDVLEERERWQLLLDAVVTMAADLSLDELLRRIIEAAADLAGARYVALGVLGVGKERRLRPLHHPRAQPRPDQGDRGAARRATASSG